MIFDTIDNYSIFLADLTFIAKTVPIEKRAPKLAPNPNVMIELGYALRSISPERLVTVMNTAYGGPTSFPVISACAVSSEMQMPPAGCGGGREQWFRDRGSIRDKEIHRLEITFTFFAIRFSRPVAYRGFCIH